jgi:hypothetical protein
MKKYLKKVAILSIASATLFGCSKDPVADISQQSVNDNTVAEDGFNDMGPAINEKGIKDPAIKSCGSCGVTGRLNANLAVLIDTATTKEAAEGGTFVTIFREINYGSNGVVSSINFNLTYNKTLEKGVLKTGTIKAILTPTKGYTAIIDGLTPGTGFDKGGIKYIANMAVTNVGPVADNKVNIKITNGTCTWANGDKVSYASDRTTVIDKTTEQITLWGTVNGTNRKGKQYSITIDATTPLVKDKACNYVTNGIQKLNEDGKQEHVLDFGYAKGGACDEFTKVTIGKVSWEYNMATGAFTKL